MNLRVTIRTKMFFLVLLVLVGAIVVLSFKTRQIFYADKFDFIKSNSRTLTTLTSSFVNERLENNLDAMTLFIEGKSWELQNSDSSADYSDLYFNKKPHFLLLSRQFKQNKKWNTQWLSQNKKHNGLDQKYSETLLRSIKYKNAAKNKLYIERLQLSNGDPMFALVSLQKNGQEAYVAFINKHYFQEVVKFSKTEITDVFVVDSRGYVVSHPEVSFLGKSFKKHPIVEKYISPSSSSGGEGIFKTEDSGAIIGSFKKIKGTNLNVVVETSEKYAFKAATKFLISMLVFGLGFSMIGLVLAYIVSSKITSPIKNLVKSANAIGLGNFNAPIAIDTNDEIGDLAQSIETMRQSLLLRNNELEASRLQLIQSEKMSAFGQLSAGLAHEIKNPLAGILGHAQLAKSKIQSPSVAKHMEVIEKETRRTKQIIENLMKFARGEKTDLEPTDLHMVVSRTLDLVDHQLNFNKIKIIKDLNSVPKINAKPNQLQQVLLNIFMNAADAMKDTQLKELYVSLDKTEEFVKIRIQDTGAGMSEETQKKIFEPFYTTKPSGQGTGLGMSVSYGIINNHNGRILVESELNRGSTFTIEIPLFDNKGVYNKPTPDLRLDADYNLGMRNFETSKAIQPENLSSNTIETPEKKTEKFEPTKSESPKDEFLVKIRKPKIKV